MKIVGILNITPDSFSDGGKYFNPLDAVERAFEIAEEGADIIDIGAESTRPGAETLSDYEEVLRVTPVIKELKKQNFKLPISLDSFKFNVAKKACDMGIDIINDVNGFKDEGMIKLVKEYGIKAIFMHSLTVPTQRDVTINESEDVIEVLNDWKKERIEVFEQNGVSKNQLIFDPGLGFGKTITQNLEIIKRVNELKNNDDCELLIGHSEKSFLSQFTKLPAGKRNIETQTINTFLHTKNVDYIRVHNVKDTVRTLRVAMELF